MSLTPTKADGCLGRRIEGSSFKSIVTSVILANTIVIAIQSDQEIRRAVHTSSDDTLPPQALATLEFCFTGFYFLELLLRFRVYGIFLLRGVDWKWNVLDIMLVTISVFDTVLGFVYKENEQASA